MHHTFDPDLVIVESRLQELPRNVHLTVDSLFHQGRLLGCNRNDIAWDQIQKTFNIPIPEPSSTKTVVDYLVKHKELMPGIAVVIVLVILLIVIVSSMAGSVQDRDPESGARRFWKWTKLSSNWEGELSSELGGSCLQPKKGRRTPEAAGCSKNHTLDPDSVEADSKRQVCNRLPDLLLTVDCLFNEGKLLSSKHNKAAYMEIIKLIATSYQGYANKIHVCSSPQKVPAPELCVSFTPVLHQLVISPIQSFFLDDPIFFFQPPLVLVWSFLSISSPDGQVRSHIPAKELINTRVVGDSSAVLAASTPAANLVFWQAS
ncbi:hypothetical protein D4764_0249100 [Takifugu flavidus]|uniref:Uncharacterized protein n=1 Tax=Takifugu flavidus TaxID=433684 RepID=A0A5C6MJ56_9TELE|nr:hypothetical protein D4764_0249100 [Takifugu flavidus]